MMYEQGHGKAEISRKEGIPQGSIYDIATRCTNLYRALPRQPEKAIRS